MTVWISKYALTQGLFQVAAKDFGDGGVQDLDSNYSSYYHKPDWHETKDGAVDRAEAMRKAAIVSTEKRLSRLKKMKF